MKGFHKYFPFVIGLLSGIYFISFQITGTQLEFYPGDLIDARFNNYILEHGYKFFTGQTDKFWNAPFMHPEKDVVTYSDNFLGSVPFYILFRIFGFERMTSFQLWYLLITVLNFSACYLFLNYLFRNKWSATLGAFVFAFSLALQSQVAHAQTYCRFPIPLAFYFATRFFEEFRPKYFFLTLITWVYQTYCGFYHGLMLLLPLGLFLLITIFYRTENLFSKLKDLKWLLQILLSAIINILILLPLLLPYMDRAKQLGFYPYENISSNVPTPLSYFFSWTGSLFWDFLNSHSVSYPNFWDHEIFAGGIATLCTIIFIIVTIFFNRKFKVDLNAIKLLSIAFGITFFLYLRFGNSSAYFFIYNIPGYGSMRALQRIINIELLFFSITTCFVFSKIISFKKEIYSGILYLILLLFLVLDNYVKPDFVHHRSKKDSEIRVNALIEKMKSIPENCIVSYEPDSLISKSMDYQLDAMLAAQSTNHICINGYSATSPGGFGEYWMNPNEKNRIYWLERKGIKNFKICVVK